MTVTLPAAATDATTFLTQMYGDVINADNTLHLRAFAADRNAPIIEEWHESIDAAVQRANQLAPTHDVYFGVSLRQFGKSRRDGVLLLPALWADIDAKQAEASGLTPAQCLDAAPLPPSLVVNSGGGLHAYWLLAAPVTKPGDIAWAEYTMTALQAQVHSDKVHDATRILRVPGTRNHKYSPPRPVTIDEQSSLLRYTLADIWNALPQPAALAEPAEQRASNAGQYAPLSVEQVQNMLTYLPTQMDYSDWLAVCLAVKSALPGPEGAQLISSWSPRLDAQGRDITADWWSRTQPERITAGTLIKLAREHGWQGSTGLPLVLEGQPLLIEHPAQTARRALSAQPAPAIEQPIGIRLSDVQPEQVSWLWPGRIPYGKLTVLDGAPGVGKSTLALDIAARLSTGQRLPDGTPTTAAGVIIVRPEDGLADTLVPRLLAAGADNSRIRAVETVPDKQGKRLFFLPAGIPVLEAAIQQEQARLVIIDSLMSVLPPELNSYRDQDMRAALSPLEALAQRTGTAILAIRHLTKATDRPALYSGGGSVGIIGVARSGLLAASHPTDEAVFVLAPTKSNLGPKPAALRYQIVPAGDASRIEWLGEDTLTADELVARRNPGEKRGAREEAKAWLTLRLDGQCAPATQLQQGARAEGITAITLARAKKELGILSTRHKFQSQSYWCPPGAALDDEQAA